MVQILLLYDKSDSKAVDMYDRLMSGFNKLGCWSAELPSEGSIYKVMLTLEKSNIKDWEDKNGKKG